MKPTLLRRWRRWRIRGIVGIASFLYLGVVFLSLWTLLVHVEQNGVKSSIRNDVDLDEDAQHGHHDDDSFSLPNPSGNCDRFRRSQQLDWDASERSLRFPSVEERVCLYMSVWYDPYFFEQQPLPPRLSPWSPLSTKQNRWMTNLTHKRLNDTAISIYWENNHIFTATISQTELKHDVPFFMNKQNVTWIQQWGKQRNWLFFPFYTSDTLKVVEAFPADYQPPILFTWGDQEIQQVVDVPVLPVFGKWRYIHTDRRAHSYNNNNYHHPIITPIVVPLETPKHFAPVFMVPENDISWEQKRNVAVWRGAFSGIVNGKFYYDYDPDFRDHPLETCLAFPRCRMVYKNNVAAQRQQQQQQHVVADLGLTALDEPVFQTLDGVHNMTKTNLSMKELLRFKMLIVVEGNDVATGLKWSLRSNSVVLMPQPVKCTFAMEMLLEPWVHYVPLDVDNVHQAIQWVLEHELEAKKIAQRSTNFMEDLLVHPQADRDNQIVLERMAKRIEALWIPSPDKLSS